MIVMADGGLYETRRAATGTGWSPRVKLPAAVNVNGTEIGAVFLSERQVPPLRARHERPRLR